MNGEGVLVIDTEEKVLFVNNRMAEMLGVTPSDIIGRAYLDFVDRDSFLAVRTYLRDISLGKGGAREVKFRMNDGHELRCMVSATAMSSRDSREQCIFILCIDATNELRDKEEFLKAAELRYRQMFDSMSVAIHMVSRDLRILLFNKVFAAWNKRFSLTEDLIGKPIFEVFPFLIKDRVTQEYEEVFATGKTLITKERSLIGQEEIFTETRKIPVFEDGRVIYVTTVVTDITQSYKLEQELLENERNYRQLVELSSAGIGVYKDGRMVFINDSGAKLLGADTPEQIVGKPVGDFIHPSCRQGLQKALPLLTENGILLKMVEEKFLRLDGGVFDVQMSATLFTYQHEPATLVFFVDISQLKKIEMDLRQQREAYRALVELSPDGIAVVVDQKIVFVNASAVKIYGFDSADQFIGNSAYEFINPPCCKALREAIDAARLRNEAIPSLETQIVARSGQVIDIESSVAFIIYNGQPAVQLVFHDITLRKKMEEILKRDKDNFEKLVIEKSQELAINQIEMDRARRLSDLGVVSATIAHELRNPLATITAAIYNIKRKFPTPEIAKNIASIEAKVLESRQIINNLLTYSRIKPPQYEKIKICAVLTECASGVKARFDGYKVLIEKHFDCDKNQVILADSVHMRELFNNILNNACESFENKQGAIRISGCYNPAGYLEFVFQDNGTGISEKNMKKIAKPFFSTKSQGLGLGLSVCNQLVDLHNGRLDIASIEGKGTTVKVTLPVNPQKPPFIPLSLDSRTRRIFSEEL